MFDTLAHKWVCASWFAPPQFVEFQGDMSHRWRVAVNPEYVSCGGWAGVLPYLIVGACFALGVVATLTFILGYYGVDTGDVFGWSITMGLISGLVWPIATLLIPAAIAGASAWRLARVARKAGASRQTRIRLAQAEEARRAKELAPYVEQIERELAGAL